MEQIPVDVQEWRLFGNISVRYVDPLLKKLRIIGKDICLLKMKMEFGNVFIVAISVNVTK